MKHMATDRGVARLLALLGHRLLNHTFDLMLHIIIALSQCYAILVNSLLHFQCVQALCTLNMLQIAATVEHRIYSSIITESDFQWLMQIKLIHFLGTELLVYWPTILSVHHFSLSWNITIWLINGIPIRVGYFSYFIPMKKCYCAIVLRWWKW